MGRYIRVQSDNSAYLERHLETALTAAPVANDWSKRPNSIYVITDWRQHSPARQAMWIEDRSRFSHLLKSFIVQQLSIQAN
jgi:hypothetical protein